MSSQTIVDFAGNKKIYDDLLPNPYPYPAQPPSLAQVLIAGDDAANGNIENLLQLQVTNVVQQTAIGGHLVIGGVPLTPGAGGDLRIQGATLKGSLLVGDGTRTNTLPVGANGLVLKANSAQPFGVEWGTDASGGTVMAVNAGDNINVTGTIAQPIVNVSNPFFVQKVNAPNTTNLTLQSSLGGESSDLILNAINATTGVSTQATLDADDSVGGNGGLVKVILTDPAVASTSVIGQVLPTTATHDTRWANAVQTSDFASHLVQSELNQTKLRCETIDTANQVNSVREDLTLPGVMLDTHTGTQLGTNIVAQRTEQTGYSLGCNQSLQYTNPASIQSYHSQQTSSLGATYQGITEDFPFGALHKGAFALSSSTTQGEVSALYEDQTIGAVYQSAGATICNSGGSTVQISSSSISAGTSHLLRMETPAIGDAVVEHISVGSVRNLVMSSQGNITTTAPTGNATLFGSGSNIVCGATSINGTSQVFQNFSSQSGTSATPNFIFKETSATTGACVIRMDKAVAPIAGNAISAISSYALDGTATPREWSRIQTKVESVGAGNQDATLSIFNSVNGTVSETFNFNGAQNENNSFRPLDMNNNDIRTATGNLTLNATASTGTGHIILQPKVAGEVQIAGAIAQLTNPAGQLNISANTNMSISANNITETSASSHTIATPSLVFTGAALQSASSSGNSGQHLVITLNGNVYKIALQNP